MLASIFDGVLADFNTNFMNLFVNHTREDKFGNPRQPITTWNYATDQFGYTKEQDKEVWATIMRSKDFWRNLRPYKNTLEFLTTLRQLPVQVTFITSRVGQKVLDQTQGWLAENGYPFPQVIISSRKGDVCRRIGVTHYLDDKNENCVDVSNVGNIAVFMAAQPYNVEQPGTTRIENILTFLDVVAVAVRKEQANG